MTAIITYGLAAKRRPPYMTKERDAFLKHYSCVDVAILADKLGLNENTVAKYMRSLGLRRFKHSARKSDGNH